MLQTASLWKEGNLSPLTIKAAGMPGKRCERQSGRERPRQQCEGCSLPTTLPQDFPSWRCYAATHRNSGSLSHPKLNRPATPHWEKWVPPCLEAQPTSVMSVSSVLIKKVHLWMTCSKVVATILHQIMTELKGAKSEEDRKMATKNCINTHEAKWLLDFIGGIYDCAGEDQQGL